MVRLRWSLAALPLLALGACGGGLPPPAPRRDDGCGGAKSQPGHTLEVYLSVDREGALAPLCMGQPLTSADVLWVTAELDIASYVRLIYSTPDGQSGEVVRQDAADLTREALFRAPRGLLSSAPGEVQIVVVASREPLSEIDPALGAMLDVIRDTGTLVDRDGSLRPPQEAGEQEPWRLDFGPQALHADFDERGVALLTLSLHTAP